MQTVIQEDADAVGLAGGRPRCSASSCRELLREHRAAEDVVLFGDDAARRSSAWTTSQDTASASRAWGPTMRETSLSDAPAGAVPG